MAMGGVRAAQRPGCDDRLTRIAEIMADYCSLAAEKVASKILFRLTEAFDDEPC